MPFRKTSSHHSRTCRRQNGKHAEGGINSKKSARKVSSNVFLCLVHKDSRFTAQGSKIHITKDKQLYYKTYTLKLSFRNNFFRLHSSKDRLSVYCLHLLSRLPIISSICYFEQIFISRCERSYQRTSTISFDVSNSYLPVSKAKLTCLEGCGVKSMWQILETEMIIYQAKGNLDAKILFGNITYHLKQMLVKG